MSRDRSGRAGITRTCRPRETSIWARSTGNSDSSTWNRRARPGNYDQEIFLAAHQWGPSLAHLGPANNGWEIAYKNGSFNDKALGHGDPIRVKQGQRVLFRLLNSSATDDISFALPGHKFKVIAMDGNPVPTQASVDVLTMGVAERVDAVVEMNQPGVWILGSIDDEERMNGMGIVIEYAGQTGEPAWVKSAKSALGLHTLRHAGHTPGTGWNLRPDVQENSRQSRRLQPLDDQRKIMAGHGSAHGAEGQALPHGLPQSDGRHAPASPASPRF